METQRKDSFIYRLCGICGRILLFTGILLAVFTLNTARPEAASRTLYASMLRSSDNKAFELRKRGMLTGTGYCVMQGGCTDGIYGYYILQHLTREECKIVKVRLSSISRSPGSAIIKVSGPLPLGHANDITYNASTGNLYIVHNFSKGSNNKNSCNKKISVVGANTLTLGKTFTVSVPRSLSGASGAQLSAIKGFCGIACDRTKGQYVLLISGSSGDFLVLNSSFTPVRYIDTDSRSRYMNQGIDCTSDRIIVIRSKGSSSSCQNVLDEYDWSGKLKLQTSIRGLAYEAENIYHIGSTFYVSCYAYNSKLYQKRFAFLCSLTTASTVEGVKLSRSSLVLKVGTDKSLTATVTPSNAPVKSVVYSSSNSRVASVNSRGLVHAAGPGDAVITACTSQGYYTSSCHVSVVSVPQPSSVKNRGKGIEVRWPKQASSTRVIIYRRTGKNKTAPFKKAGTARGSRGSFTDRKVRPGVFYSYKLASKNGSLVTKLSPKKSTWRMKRPHICSIRSYSPTTISLSWTRVTGASGYRVVYSRRKDFKTRTGVNIYGGTGTGTVLTRGLKKNSLYYVKVYAFHKNKEIVYSDASGVLTVRTPLQ